jgi:peptidoglycan hydrolase-like protein with peptidoglycan-binding domain
MRAAQFRLTRLGFHPGAVDGIAGVATLAAIAEFQKLKGINPDGVLGARTKELLLGK